MKAYSDIEVETDLDYDKNCGSNNVRSINKDKRC